MAIRRAAAAGMVLLLAACGSSEHGEGLTPEQMNALGLGSNRSVEAPPSPDMIGLDPLNADDMASMAERPSCMLRVGGQPVLAAAQYSATVKRYGEVTQLRVDGPVGGTGGFFQNEVISISVGRPRDRAAPDQMASGPARARLNDRRRGTSSEVEADWSCGS